MGAKLERIAAERDKARRKRDEWDARVKELERKYSDMWKATINDPDGVEESEPFLNKQEEIGEQIVKLEQKLKELKKNQN